MIAGKAAGKAGGNDSCWKYVGEKVEIAGTTQSITKEAKRIRRLTRSRESSPSSPGRKAGPVHRRGTRWRSPPDQGGDRRICSAQRVPSLCWPASAAWQPRPDLSNPCGFQPPEPHTPGSRQVLYRWLFPIIIGSGPSSSVAQVQSNTRRSSTGRRGDCCGPLDTD